MGAEVAALVAEAMEVEAATGADTAAEEEEGATLAAVGTAVEPRRTRWASTATSAPTLAWSRSCSTQR